MQFPKPFVSTCALALTLTLTNGACAPVSDETGNLGEVEEEQSQATDELSLLRYGEEGPLVSCSSQEECLAQIVSGPREYQELTWPAGFSPENRARVWEFLCRGLLFDCTVEQHDGRWYSRGLTASEVRQKSLYLVVGSGTPISTPPLRLPVLPPRALGPATQAEMDVAAHFAGRGATRVRVRGTNAAGPDLMVRGVPTWFRNLQIEVKTITTWGRNTFLDRLKEGLRQGPNVFIDMRPTGQPYSVARDQIQRALGSPQLGPPGQIIREHAAQRIWVWTNEGVHLWQPMWHTRMRSLIQTRSPELPRLAATTLAGLTGVALIRATNIHTKAQQLVQGTFANLQQAEDELLQQVAEAIFESEELKSRFVAAFGGY